MSTRYNRVDCGMWTGESFRALSKMVCSGQALWLYLLTCDSRHSAGIWKIGPGEISDDTGWSIETISQMIDEIITAGLIEYDRESKVIRLVKGLSKTPIQNPNVVKSWVNHIEALPNCNLKIKHLHILKEITDGIIGEKSGEPFSKPFDDLFPKGLPEPLTESPTTTPTPTPAPAPTPDKPRRQKTANTNSEVKEFIDWYSQKHLEVTGSKVIIAGAKDGSTVKRLLGQVDLEELKKRAELFLNDSKSYPPPGTDKSITKLVLNVNKYAGTGLPEGMTEL